MVGGGNGGGQGGGSDPFGMGADMFGLGGFNGGTTGAPDVFGSMFGAGAVDPSKCHDMVTMYVNL